MCDLEPIEVLLVEDDPGDELMTREAFEDNKIRNRLHVARDGEEALDFLYRRGGTPTRPGPTLSCSTSTCPSTTGGRSSSRSSPTRSSLTCRWSS